MKRASPIPCQDQKHGSSCHGNKIEWKQKNKLHNLPQGKRRVDGAHSWFPQRLHRVGTIWMQSPRRTEQFLLPSIQEYGIEDIDQRLVHEECLEEQPHDYG